MNITKFADFLENTLSHLNSLKECIHKEKEQYSVKINYDLEELKEKLTNK
jgi:flagellar biosynthesis/type III secretory pathway chaperone